MGRLKARMTLEIVPSPEFMMLTERITELTTDPEVFVRIIKIALSQTLLRVYAQRFMAGLPEALHTVVSGRDPHPRKVSKDLTRSLQDAMQSLAMARAEENATKAATAERRVQRLKDAYSRSLKGPSAEKPHSKFAEMVNRAMAIMDLFTNPNSLGVSKSRGEIRVGLGDLAKLDAIETPSAGRGASKMRVLWRHLEFGTGVYSLDKRINAASPYKVKGGAGQWYFGRHGTIIEGSMPIHMLRLFGEFQQSPEAKDFARVMTDLLTQALTI